MTYDLDSYLTPEMLHQYLCERGIEIGIARVRRALAEGDLPGRKIGGRYVTPMAMLARWEEGLPMIGDPALTEAFAALERGELPQAPKAPALPFIARRAS
jgi:hypothetical protein